MMEEVKRKVLYDIRNRYFHFPNFITFHVAVNLTDIVTQHKRVQKSSNFL